MLYLMVGMGKMRRRKNDEEEKRVVRGENDCCIDAVRFCKYKMRGTLPARGQTYNNILSKHFFFPFFI